MSAHVKVVDLTGSPVIDDHCHGFRAADLVELDPLGWEDRLTMMGMCFLSSGQTDRTLAGQVTGLRDSTVFALTARRWLAERLGVEPEPQALAAARAAAIGADPEGYCAGLLAEQNITAVIADEGYPQPPVLRAEFERSLGVPVHRVARIEPLIVALQALDLSWPDFEAGFEARLEEAASDAHTVGFKSIIAYRTGLDVGTPTAAEAGQAYDLWRAAGWPKDRGPGKVVRDYCLRATLRAARRHDLVMHLHCGGGDPDIVLAHARPQDAFGLLHDHIDQPIILIHGGYPWMAEAAYVASILPFVYLDLSEFLPWATLGIDRELEMLLGVVPAGKILYGSDEASEPEVFWLSARMAREALERVLTSSVQRDFLTVAEALEIGRGVLAGNTARLHGFA
ncbi:MAG: amidohydrolase family protein [Actinobacteria bacterium]|nr:amidohydrolase family protein [Actinomycetota bacterium]